MNQQDVINALGGLIGWLETWRTEEGAYHGFVIHRTGAKRMKFIHDTAWTQAAIIRGYTNLYRKSREARWYNAMVLAADLQASRFEPETGKYQFAGHEDDRYCSLVHCALANCALLGTLEFVDMSRREKYLSIVKQNVDRYWMPLLWVEEEGAFRFSEVDYSSPNEHRFVVNFNCMAAEALLALANFTDQQQYRDIALQVGKWLIERCNHARQYNSKLLWGVRTVGDDPTSRWMPLGGLAYQYTPTQRDPDNCVTLYNGLSLRGIWALYKAAKDEAYATIACETAEFLLAMRDPETHLFYHTTKQGRIEPYPQFIAGAGMTLLGLHEVLLLISDKALAEDTVGKILSYAYANGSFPSFIGMNRTCKPKDKTAVWEDVVAAVNWNAQLFEYLTRIVESPSAIRINKPETSLRIISKRFLYLDKPRSVTIISWWPPRFWGLYIMQKLSTRALLSFKPRRILSAAKSRSKKHLEKNKQAKNKNVKSPTSF